MKIAITSTGNSPEAKLDSRFGRGLFFVIYDTVSHSTEFIPNPYIENIEGAGLASANLIASKGAEKVVSGEFGAKVKSLFDSMKIKLVILKDPEKRINSIIELLNH